MLETSKFARYSMMLQSCDLSNPKSAVPVQSEESRVARKSSLAIYVLS